MTHVRQYATCNRNNTGNLRPHSALELCHLYSSIEKEWFNISESFICGESGSVYILVIPNHIIKRVELIALSAQNAALLVTAFLNHFIVTFGCLPHVIKE